MAKWILCSRSGRTTSSYASHDAEYGTMLPFDATVSSFLQARQSNDDLKGFTDQQRISRMPDAKSACLPPSC